MDTAIVVDGTPASRPYRIAHYPVAMIDRIGLTDGRSVLVRPILPQDAEPLQAFVQRLSPGTRYRRFHMGVRELPAAVLRAFTELDYAQHLGLLAEVFDADERQTVIADARLIRRGAEPVADAAIVIADDWQGLGLGRHLIGKLLQSASRRGLAAVEADVVADNAPMLRLLARLGFSLRAQPDDARLVQARLELPAPQAPQGGANTGTSAPLALAANETRTRWPIASASKSQSTRLVSMLTPSSSFT